jgi:hypothetical protein
MDLSDLKNDKGEPIFADPRHVGQSEYRALHELCGDIVESFAYDEEEYADNPIASLACRLADSMDEIKRTADSLGKQLQQVIARESDDNETST